MVPIAVVAGDPVGCGDDIDARLEQGAVQVDVRPDAVEGHDVGLGLEHVGQIAGRHHPESGPADDLAGVTAHLVGRVAVEADEFEVGVVDDPPDHFGAHVACGELEHPKRLLRHRPTLPCEAGHPRRARPGSVGQTWTLVQRCVRSGGAPTRRFPWERGGGRTGILLRMEEPNQVDLSAMTVEVAVRFDAPRQAVWDLLTDVERMAGLGPEHFRARWLTPAPAVGARFQGWNRIGDRVWDVICVVTECHPPESVAWNVGEGPLASSTWSYRITPGIDGSSLVTQHFRHGPGGSGVRDAVERYPDRADEIVAGRSAALRSNMVSTLEAAAQLLGEPRTTGPT